MALPVFKNYCVVPLALALSGAALAESSSSFSPANRLTEVAQFGGPRDAKFVFCSEGTCPERSIKHLAVVAQQMQMAPQASPISPEPIADVVELSRAKDSMSKPVASKRPKKKPKRPVSRACTPVSAT